jgi:RNA polymerase primary sigma factor
MKPAAVPIQMDDEELVTTSASPEEEESSEATSSEGSYSGEYTLHQYMREVNAIPLLSHEETMNLFRDVEERLHLLQEMESSEDPEEMAGKRESLNREVSEIKQLLVTSNLRLVVFLANRYQGRGISIQDLVQEGNIGLIRAIDKFDYHLGYRFSTYATWWIRQGMLRAIQQQGRLIRIPTHMLEKYQRYMREIRELPAGEEEDSERDGANWAAEETIQPEMAMLMEVMRDPLSLDAPMTDDGLDLQEVTQDENQVAPEEMVIDQDLRDKLRTAMGTLPLREEVILRLRYGINISSSHTLEEVGTLFSLTKERIRQIESRALRRLNALHAS